MKKLFAVLLALCMLFSLALAETATELEVLIHLTSAYMVDGEGNAVECTDYGFDFYSDLETFTMTYGDDVYQGTYALTETGFSLNDGANDYEAVWNNEAGWYEMVSGDYTILLVADDVTVTTTSTDPMVRLDSMGVLDKEGNFTELTDYVFYLYADGSFIAFWSDGSGEGTYEVLENSIAMTDTVNNITIELPYDEDLGAYLMDTGDYYLVLVASIY